ncbi:MAG: insulinase family protein, partial [Reyranella sp.]
MNALRRVVAAAFAGLLALLPAVAGAIDIKEVTTPLGLKAWLVEDKSTPVVALSFSFSGGTASDPAGQAGITDLMAELLTDGAGPFAAQAFSQRQQDAGASVGFSASLDRLGGSLRVLSANREEGFELLRLALTQPRFDGDMLEQRRAQTIASLNQATQRPGTVASRTLMATLFAGHPYAADPQGTREGLAAVTPDLLKKRAATLLMRSGLTIAAVGDISEAELARQIDRAFGSLPMGVPLPLPPQWAPPTKPRTVVVERPVPQSTVLMALPGIARDDPEWYAAMVMNHVLGGGGQQSRLFNEVREKRG